MPSNLAQACLTSRAEQGGTGQGSVLLGDLLSLLQNERQREKDTDCIIPWTIIAGGLFALMLWAMGTATTRALYSGLAIALGVILVQLVSFFINAKKGKQ